MNMSKELKKDWLPKLQARYARRHREGKSRMLDELCEDYKYERKYAIKLLSGGLAPAAGRARPGPERRYVEIESVVQYIWLKAEQPCGKRLVPILRQLGEIVRFVRRLAAAQEGVDRWTVGFT